MLLYKSEVPDFDLLATSEKRFPYADMDMKNPQISQAVLQQLHYYVYRAKPEQCTTSLIDFRHTLVVYRRYHLSKDVAIGSEKSQRRGDKNRCNNNVVYVNSQNRFEFGCANIFVSVYGLMLALVVPYRNVNIDRVSRTANFSGESPQKWIEASTIKGLFGIFTGGRKNLIVTDVTDVFSE